VEQTTLRLDPSWARSLEADREFAVAPRRIDEAFDGGLGIPSTEPATAKSRRRAFRYVERRVQLDRLVQSTRINLHTDWIRTSMGHSHHVMEHRRALVEIRAFGPNC
jgi:hypothetical protein